MPSVVDSNLSVRVAAAGLITPVSMAFLGPNDFFVLEKNTGKVQHFVNGIMVGTVLDLNVNFGSERGLLGIALHPGFPGNPGVYLFWTEPTEAEDTAVLAAVPLLGNRVDRFTWDGSTLAFERNIIRLRAYQADAGQPLRGNHNGGVLRFGPDGKLYIVIGDNGRRGWLQNLACGPTAICPGMMVPDDQFGGPLPDDAHLTGVILRLNDDGTTPADNPLTPPSNLSDEVAANIRKIFAYGLRNCFGMAFDPESGMLWEQENGDDTFSELNRVIPGLNSAWVQIMGPADRIAQFKAIETDQTTVDPVTRGMYFGLQQVRWPPTLIADTAQEAISRLVMLPGAQLKPPEFSWKFEVSPGGIGFMHGRALGPQYEGDLFVGGARDLLEGGHLFHLNLTGNRRMIGVDDPRLEDRVADNPNKFSIVESESLLFGRNFGTATDIQTGPNGNLYVVSITKGNVYEIFRDR